MYLVSYLVSDSDLSFVLKYSCYIYPEAVPPHIVA
jgi:hypothetical protein